jgi:SAM-dependent methyltransferase
MEQRAEKELAWNGRRGNAWVDLQPIMDRLFLPLQHILVDAVGAISPRQVLDVGCGTGATTLAVARKLGPAPECIGIDISDVMIEHARRRAAREGAANARFLTQDAQRFPLAAQTFDMVISRFGVMFFDDPVAAFANIRRAVRPGGRLACLVWRSRDENPFMTVADRAVGPLLGWDDATKPDDPGQFAFAEPKRVRRILVEAGWRGVEFHATDISCTLGKAELAVYARRMGRVGTVLADLDAALRDRVTAALDAGFTEFLTGDTAEFRAACWMVTANR